MKVVNWRSFLDGEDAEKGFSRMFCLKFLGGGHSFNGGQDGLVFFQGM